MILLIITHRFFSFSDNAQFADVADVSVPEMNFDYL